MLRFKDWNTRTSTGKKSLPSEDSSAQEWDEATVMKLQLGNKDKTHFVSLYW